jgi:hypothetical protein
MASYRPTGCCPVCIHRYRLRVDRTLGAHSNPFTGKLCPGTGQEDINAEHNRQVRARAAAAREAGDGH